MAPKVRVAVEGCGHGTLKAIYASVQKSCEVKGWDGVDVLIIGGDFQAVRNSRDLNCMSVPMKYREIGDFHEYYSGARTAPYLTIFVGGNHEASNHSWELYFGGWAAPNIYYLGAANVLRVGSLRIAGVSGIWKGYDYRKTHFERLPYNSSDVRSAFHIRELDVRKMLQIRSQVDVGLSHDWPDGVEWLGDHKWLFRKKDLFEADARAGTLGSKAARYLLDWLRPPHWFSAHLHIKYAAVVEHKKQGPDKTMPASMDGAADVQQVANEDEISLDMEDDDDNDTTAPDPPTTQETPTVDDELRAQLPAAFQKPPPEPEPLNTITNTTTNFLALDKCLPNRDFLQLLEIEALRGEEGSDTRPLPFTYDPEWLAITRAFALHEPLQLEDIDARVPLDKGRATYAPLIAAEAKWIAGHVPDLTIPHNFQLTAPIYDPSEPITTGEGPKEYNNPQTAAFCQLLDIPNPFYATEPERLAREQAGPRAEPQASNGFGGMGRGRGGRGGRGGDRGFGGRGRGRGRGRG